MPFPMTTRTTTDTAMRIGLALLLALPVSGCLEVEQHPPFVNGHYDGKPDDLPERVVFNGNTQAWAAAVGKRQMKQNEYNRTRAARKE